MPKRLRAAKRRTSPAAPRAEKTRPKRSSNFSPPRPGMSCRCPKCASARRRPILPPPARPRECKPLNGPSSSKDTRLVEIDLRDSGMTYKPGVALGVFPENCPEQVDELLAALGLSGAEDVPGWDGLPMSLRD